VAFVLDAEERPGEVVERAPVAAQLAQFSVDIQPQQNTLVVVIRRALPARNLIGAATAENRLMRGVLQVAPHAARTAERVGRGDAGEHILSEVRGPESGAGRQ